MNELIQKARDIGYKGDPDILSLWSWIESRHSIRGTASKTAHLPWNFVLLFDKQFNANGSGETLKETIISLIKKYLKHYEQ